MNSFTTSEDVQGKADSIVSTLTLPPEITQIQLELGDDSSGTPAIWIVLKISRGKIKQRSDIKKITKFAGEVQVKLLHSGIDRFPYIKFEEVA